MQPLVLTLATDGYDAIWRFCLDSQRSYCGLLGYTHRLVTKPLPGLNAKWSKLQVALEAIREGRDVLLIDADAEITPLAPGFVDTLDNLNGDIGAVKGVSGRINSGVIMLSGRPGSVAPAFLSDCLNSRQSVISPEDFVTADGENGHVIHTLKRSPFHERMRYLEQAWNCSLPDMAAISFVRHYTNHLRAALYTREGLRRLCRSWRPTSAADSKKRDVFASHYSHRAQTSSRLSSSQTLLDEFKAKVMALMRIDFPRLVVDDVNAWLWRYEFALGLLELPTLEFVRRLVRPDMWIVDGGAHVGYFTEAFLESGATSKLIIAVEAHPENVRTLWRNVRSRGVNVLACALGDADRRVSLNDGSGHSNSSLVEGGPATGKTYRIQMRSLDSLAKDIGVDLLGIMKLDIEGAEPLALMGARELLDRSEDAVLIVESNPRMLKLASSSPTALVQEVGAMGFIGRMILDDFSLGPAGVIFPGETVNVAFARPSRWESILAS